MCRPVVRETRDLIWVCNADPQPDWPELEAVIPSPPGVTWTWVSLQDRNSL